MKDGPKTTANLAPVETDKLVTKAVSHKTRNQSRSENISKVETGLIWNGVFERLSNKTLYLLQIF